MSAGAVEAHTTIDLSDVHTSLRELWSSEALRDVPVVRAKTQNIIICATRDDVGADDEAIINLAITHPGRLIVIETGPGDPRLVCEGSVYCRMERDKHICGELISLRAPGAARDEAHSTVVSLYLPDLPVYVWWRGGPPVDDHLFDEIAEDADRVYLDSHRFSNPTADLATVASLKTVRVGDLNWTRLVPWRQMLAQLYDVPDVREELKAMRSVEIHYAADEEPPNPNRALLLLGWLADRLGWSVPEAASEGEGVSRFRFRSAGGQVEVSLVPRREDDVENGELLGVFIEAGEGDSAISPRAVMGDGRGSLELWLPKKQTTPNRAMPYTPRAPATLLADALNEPRDPEYDIALAWAGQFVATLK